MNQVQKAVASIAAIIAVAGLGAALYSCGSETDSPSGDMGKGNPDRSGYYNRIWLEVPAGKTEFGENSFWAANEWEDLFHAFKNGDKSFYYAFGPGYGQDRYERHLRAAGIPYIHKDNGDTVDVTKIISIRGWSASWYQFWGDPWTEWK
jgi:hypothetical protein